MAKQKSKNTEPTLQDSVEKLVSEDIKKEITIGKLKDRLKGINGYSTDSKVFEFAIIEALNIPIESYQ